MHSYMNTSTNIFWPQTLFPFHLKWKLIGKSWWFDKMCAYSYSVICLTHQKSDDIHTKIKWYTIIQIPKCINVFIWCWVIELGNSITRNIYAAISHPLFFTSSHTSTKNVNNRNPQEKQGMYQIQWSVVQAWRIHVVGWLTGKGPVCNITWRLLTGFLYKHLLRSSKILKKLN